MPETSTSANITTALPVIPSLRPESFENCGEAAHRRVTVFHRRGKRSANSGGSTKVHKSRRRARQMPVWNRPTDTPRTGVRMLFGAHGREEWLQPS